MRRKGRILTRKCNWMAIRDSSFELLRNLAMFFVLVIHANFVSLPRPTVMDLSASPVITCFRYLIESMGIMGVNAFILISGWFRVKTDSLRLFNFIFQILFFWLGGYLVFLLLGRTNLSLDGILNCFAFTRWDWFIKSYAVLLIIAPILNSYIDHVTEKQLRNVLISFFLFQSTYGWIGGGSRFFVDGYGPLSFIGLYLLAQYVRITSGRGERTFFHRNTFLFLFFISVILNTIFILLLIKSDQCVNNLLAYCNPLVIIGALFLLLFFSKLNIKPNKAINWLGASSFAVYLLHSQVNIRPLFTNVIVSLSSSFHGLSVIIFIFIFLLLTYIFSVLVDQIRILFWIFICSFITKEYV